MKNAKTIAKHQKFMDALVAAFGEGTVVKRKEVVAVWLKNKDEYPHLVAITKNLDYRVGRGTYVVTASTTPKTVRDAVVAKQVTVAVKKEKTKLPATVRKNPAKLAKTILATKKADIAMPKNLELAEDEHSTEDDDINELLRVQKN